MNATVDDRFDAKVDRSGGPDACWPWTRGIGSHGYDVHYLRGGVQVLAHRHALTLATRPPLPGEEARHSCNTKRCVNPRHLSWGTHAENMDDAARDGLMFAPNANREACPQGHLLTESNVIRKTKTNARTGKVYQCRGCRECNRLDLQRRRATRRAA